MRKLTAGVLAAVAVAVLLVLQVMTGPSDQPPRPRAGMVWPTPQQMTQRPDGFPLGRTVGLVRDGGTDPAALDVVTEALKGAGVQDVKTASTDPNTTVTVWLSQQAQVLGRLRVNGSAGLPPEGYVLAIGDDRGRGQVVLDGADAAGLYYAAQTLRQLMLTGQPAPDPTRPKQTPSSLGQSGAGTGRLPGVAIRDWPSMRYRGSIEGFYGTPWTHAERLDHVDYLGAHKMNTYEYSPKNDPYLRDRWRDPYPADRMKQFAEVIARARRDHVEYAFALSPGLSICYSSPADVAALLAKFDAMYAIGARTFVVPLDDIDYAAWHCDGDGSTFGTGLEAAARAQSHLLNQVVQWARGKGDVRPVQTVPTEYFDVTDTPYKRILRQSLDPSVVMMWTGTDVVPAAITTAQAAGANKVFGHAVLVWDNYPVNDYIPGRLPLAAYTGRQSGLSGQVLGVLSNPANQAAVSKVSLFSYADFGWHDATYQPAQTWSAALAELAGGDRATEAALRAFADVSTLDGKLHGVQAPGFASHVAEFWQRWRDGDLVGSVDALRKHVEELAAAPARIRSGVADAGFIEQAGPWLDATALWGQALRAAVDVLAAENAGDEARASAARQRIDDLVVRAEAIRDKRSPHAGTSVKIGDGVLDTFVTAVEKQFAGWLAGARQPTAATTSLGTYQDNVPARMVDGMPDTFYSSDAPPSPGDYVGVDLSRPHQIGSVTVSMGTPESPDDYIHAGTIECSTDGSTWRVLATGSTPVVGATAPGGTSARYVRYRATGDNSGDWVSVREFTVQILDR